MMVTPNRNYSPTSRPIHPSQLMRGVIQLSSLAMILLGVSFWSEQVKAQQTCSSTYNPPRNVQERRRRGWFDGRVGRISVANNTPNPALITLYHPDSGSIFKYWVMLPGETYFLGNDNYGSDWGIQLNDENICLIGRVSNWRNNVFETAPGRLSTSSPDFSLTGPAPADLERQGNNLIARGNRREGIALLNKAATYYLSNNQRGDQQRVLQRIRQLERR